MFLPCDGPPLHRARPPDDPDGTRSYHRRNRPHPLRRLAFQASATRTVSRKRSPPPPKPQCSSKRTDWTLPLSHSTTPLATIVSIRGACMHRPTPGALGPLVPPASVAQDRWPTVAGPPSWSSALLATMPCRPNPCRRGRLSARSLCPRRWPDPLWPSALIPTPGPERARDRSHPGPPAGVPRLRPRPAHLN